MSFASKVRAAHKKHEVERNQKMQMYAAAMNALAWWEQTNGRADSAINQGIKAAERVSTFKLAFHEWARVCPAPAIRWFFNHWYGGPMRINDDVREAYEAAEVWRVAVLLGGKANLSPTQIAKETDLPLERVQVILKQLGDEAKAEMQRKIEAEVARRDGMTSITPEGKIQEGVNVRQPRPVPPPAGENPEYKFR
jgi:hypothetical protein